MAIKTSFDQKRNVSLYCLHGEISFDEIKNSLHEESKNSNHTPVLNILWDLSNANIVNISAEQVRQIASLVAEKWENYPRSKAALIAVGEFEFGMARMYEIYLDHKILGKVQVFRTKDEAFDWLDMDE